MNTTFLLYIDVEEKKRAQEAARRADQSLAAWVRCAIREKSERDGKADDESC